MNKSSPNIQACKSTPESTINRSHSSAKRKDAISRLVKYPILFVIKGFTREKSPSFVISVKSLLLRAQTWNSICKFIRASWGEVAFNVSLTIATSSIYTRVVWRSIIWRLTKTCMVSSSRTNRLSKLASTTTKTLLMNNWPMVFNLILINKMLSSINNCHNNFWWKAFYKHKSLRPKGRKSKEKTLRSSSRRESNSFWLMDLKKWFYLEKEADQKS